MKALPTCLLQHARFFLVFFLVFFLQFLLNVALMITSHQAVRYGRALLIITQP